MSNFIDLVLRHINKSDGSRISYSEWNALSALEREEIVNALLSNSHQLTEEAFDVLVKLFNKGDVDVPTRSS